MAGEPTVYGVAHNEKGEVLMLRGESREWSLLGGALEPGEDPSAGLARMVLEQTGVQLESKEIGSEVGVIDPDGRHIKVFAIDSDKNAIQLEDDPKLRMLGLSGILWRAEQGRIVDADAVLPIIDGSTRVQQSLAARS